jgi:hypothetical protein
MCSSSPSKLPFADRLFYISRHYFTIMKKACAFLFLLTFAPAFPQPLLLSDQARISIITLGPDQREFYEAFGHSAIRVFDPVHGIDYAFNYGVFSFDQPNFYLNFTRGHLLYQLGVYPYPDFKEAYISYNRFVHEQRLTLTAAQRQKIFNYLQWNARPENKSYLYDYFFNNCSTRIRDVFADVLKGEILFDGSFITTHYTIRELERRYLDEQPWGDLGINIGLGHRIDREATPYEYMYLPDYLESSFDHAFIITDGKKVPIVEEKLQVYEAKPVPPDVSFFSPWKVFGSLLAVAAGLSIWDWRRKKRSAWFDVMMLSGTGLLGLTLLFLWFGTDHHACVNNFNLLWALPPNIVAAVLVLTKNKPVWLARYFEYATFLMLIILAAWKFLPQPFTPFLIPLIVTLTLRYAVNWRLLKR